MNLSHLRPYASRIILGILAIGLTASLGAQGHPPLEERIQTRVQARLMEFQKESGFPGAVFGWSLPDGKSGAVAFGLADRDTGAKMRPDSRMLAGSAGKTFFAAWILRLVEEGKLDLDKPISTWIGAEPWFDKLPNARALTLRCLLRHQSGIREHVYDEGLVSKIKSEPDKVWSPQELIGFMLDTKPLFEAGKGWSYADANFVVAAYTAEKATGQSAYREIERLFLKRFNLKLTIPSDRRILPGLVQGHVSTGMSFTGSAKSVVNGKMVINPQFEWAGGGFLSNARDLARWTQALFGGKVLGDAMSKAQKEGVPASTGAGPGEEYGLGVQIFEEPGGKGFGHGGFFPGYLTEMELFPSGVSVAIQFNADGGRPLIRNLRRYLRELAAIVEEESGGREPTNRDRPECAFRTWPAG